MRNFASGNRPYFIDIELKEFGIDPDLLINAPSKIKAIIAIHSFGIPYEIISIAEIA